MNGPTSYSSGGYTSQEMNRHRGTNPRMDAGKAYYDNPKPRTPVAAATPPVSAATGAPPPVKKSTQTLDLRDVDFKHWPRNMLRKVAISSSMLVMVYADQVKPMTDLIASMETSGELPVGLVKVSGTAAKKPPEEGGFGRMANRVVTKEDLAAKKLPANPQTAAAPADNVTLESAREPEEDLDNM